MEIKKIANESGTYDFKLIDGEKTLRILFGGNLDLYMVLENGNMMPSDETISLDFYISKENYEIYSLFDTLYKDVISGKVFDDADDDIDDDIFSFNVFGQEDDRDWTKRSEYKYLVDDNLNINWISDDGPIEAEDMVRISKLDDDTYRLTFIRNDKPMDFKSPVGISVRFRNSGSKYDPFNLIFMRMFNKLQEVDPAYHQIHVEELAYVKKIDRK